MNLAESRRDEKILSMDDWELIQAVLGTSRDEALSVQEYEAFKEMSIFVAGGRTLSVRQRAWLEEAARKVIPVDSRLVPRGKEVATPTVLQKLPIKPPGRR